MAITLNTPSKISRHVAQAAVCAFDGVVFYIGWLVGVPSIWAEPREGLWPLVVADSVALAWVSYLFLRVIAAR